jgi:hypothetical protein
LFVDPETPTPTTHAAPPDRTPANPIFPKQFEFGLASAGTVLTFDNIKVTSQ